MALVPLILFSLLASTVDVLGHRHGHVEQFKIVRDRIFPLYQPWTKKKIYHSTKAVSAYGPRHFLFF